MVKLLDAINREGVDNQFWAVNSYENSWNAAEVFGGANQTESDCTINGSGTLDSNSAKNGR